ncbi:Transcription termination and cleavage factor [Parasponia andersonii]|uniref:Transcription termination and cleavage factor n=1 Tax=Parasponia andersonii TaxID=3476 RepID=A0A2P5DEG1_PARAD|nr:Transcription termination and cleavage factor [Parasponia andersonii]
MAGKQVQVAGDGLPANLAGMTKNQLYDIMSQMKTLIDQNQQQARQILIQNPLLTKALFQAQIMLGMVHPPQVIPNIEKPPPQHSQQSTQLTQQSNNQATQSLSGQMGVKDQAGASQMQTPARMQHQNQPAMATSSAAVPAVHIQPQPTPLHPLQTPQQPRGHLQPQVAATSHSQSPQLPNLPTLPLHSSSQPPPLHPSQMPTHSTQLQQPLQTTGIPHLPLQPPLPPQPRPHSLGNFQHQYPSQMGTNMSFQHAGPPQHLAQPMFHPGTKPPASIGPSFSHPQHQLPSQPPPQSVYQVGNMPLGTEFNNQVTSSMQVDRGSAWMSAPPENSSLTQLSAPPSLVPGQMGPGNQPPRAQSLSPEMEKALLQQVMSLTPDQINLLPPEQRNQVLQLQQILRQ